jgi:hypothetical protein
LEKAKELAGGLAPVDVRKPQSSSQNLKTGVWTKASIPSQGRVFLQGLARALAAVWVEDLEGWGKEGVGTHEKNRYPR